MKDVTFVVHKEWLDNIAGLPVEQQDKIIADIVRYGVEMKMEHENDPVISSLVNMIKGRIDYSKNKYEEKIVQAKKAGRKKRIDDDEILRLARGGKSSSEIAKILGYSKSSVDHSEGWKKRKEKNEMKNQDFLF